MSILTECREEKREKVINSRRKRRAEKREKEIKARRLKLTQMHYDIFDWLMCIEDNIVLGNDEEAKDFIKQLNAYTEKLAILLAERQQRRLSKSKTTNNIEHES